MRKALIGIIVILLGVFIYIMLTKSISFAGYKIESINDIQNANNNLDNKFSQVDTLTKQTYPKGLSDFKSAVTDLNTAKTDYESKIANLASTVDLGTVQIDTYQIESLWIKVGNYAKKEGVMLTLDLVQGSGSGLYNLNFKLFGNYTSITDFVYDIENDADLHFQIDNFTIIPGGNSMDSSTGSAPAPTTTPAANATSTNVNGDINTPNGRVDASSNSATNAINTATGTQTGTTSGTGTDTVNLNATFTVTDVGVKMNNQ